MTKRVPSPDLRIGEDEAARLLDDAVDRREAEAGALAHLLGGEERLEDLAEHAGRNAAAGVGDRQRAVVGDRQDVGAELRDLVRLHRIGLDRQRSAALRHHRVAGVDREVDDHLLELARVGADRPEVAAMLDDELDRLAEQPLQQVRHFRDDVGKLEHLRPQRLLAREGEQLAGQAGGAVRVRLDLLDVVIIAVAGRMPHQHQVAVADDRGQDVVEIVRDAAGELADDLHLGRLRDLALELGLLAIVLEQQQHRGIAQPAQARRWSAPPAPPAGARAAPRGRPTSPGRAHCGEPRRRPRPCLP